ncbi:Uncharacterized protein conserved in bacteria [Mycobacteroides abscessus subsp. abscessus]|nr:Uncharacterized protein conserved in bacteria [Mycobacteroides abscessus subsp. abscessus]
MVAGQRIMQASGDPFLGYVTSTRRGSFYVRQFRDMKGSVDITSLTNPDDLALYGSLCAIALARAHAQSGVPGVIAGYLGGGTDPNRVRRFRRGLFAAQSRGPAAATRGHRRGMAADILMS